MEGLKEQFSDAENLRAVLKVMKPGNVKDMLMNKDDLKVEELKVFLHSNLGEQINTALFQVLMCTKEKTMKRHSNSCIRIRVYSAGL